MRTAFIVLLALHGAIHLLGFAKSFHFAELAQLKRPIPRALGVLWLVAGTAFLASAVLFVLAPESFWLLGAPAVVLSQILVFSSFRDAKLGSVPNFVILVPIALSLLDLRSSSFRSTYDREVARGLARPAESSPVTEADLAKLPAPVQTYLRRVGVAGKSRVHDVRVRWRGQMKPARDAAWMDARIEQTNFFDAPSRLFLMDATRYGVPFQALHRFIGPNATMQVRVASLFEVVDARGPEMNQSETVTMWNDMCVLAPATLPFADARWQALDDRTVRSWFSNEGTTISADLSFDVAGDLVGFVSNDRLQSADGKRYESYPWSTPLSDYHDFGGVRLASRGEALWREPAGDFVYGRFVVEDVAYNVGRAPEPLDRASDGALSERK